MKSELSWHGLSDFDSMNRSDDTVWERVASAARKRLNGLKGRNVYIVKMAVQFEKTGDFRRGTQSGCLDDALAPVPVPSFGNMIDSMLCGSPKHNRSKLLIIRLGDL